MDAPITLRFRLNENDLKQADSWGEKLRVHEEKKDWWRPIALFALMTCNAHFRGNEPWSQSFFFSIWMFFWLAVVFYVLRFILRKLVASPWLKKLSEDRVSLNPENDGVEIELSDDRIAYKGFNGSQDANWKAIYKAVSTPDGLMLFWRNAYDLWVPRRVLDGRTFSRVYDLVKRKAKKFHELEVA